jgi:hypothetical protein
MEINITIDQNEDTEIGVDDITAQAGQKILVQFFSNKINVFNLATQNAGGKPDEVQIALLTGYSFTVSDILALLCSTTEVVEWQLWKINDTTVNSLLHFGSVTVTPLETSSPGPVVIPFYNMDRIRPAVDDDPITVDDTLTANDDIVIYTPAVDTEIDSALPTASLMIGKQLIIYNNGDGIVNLQVSSVTTFVLAAKTDSFTLRATSIGWIKV